MPTNPLAKHFPLQRYATVGCHIRDNDQFDLLAPLLKPRLTRDIVTELFTHAGLLDIRVEPDFGWIAYDRRPIRAEG
jgi:hypothetical protein